MLRFLGTFGFLFIFLTLTAPLVLLEKAICSVRGRSIDSEFAWKVIRVVFFICQLTCGVDPIYRGRENIPDDTAVLYVGNHKSYFDIILSYRAFKGPTGYVAKKELKVFSLGVWMEQISCIFLDRGDPKSSVDMIKQSVDNINKNISVCIFPEGTRSHDLNSIGDFHNGSFKAAVRMGAPIIPMAIIGTRNVWENHQPFVIPSKVIIEFGEPIYPKELSKEELKEIGNLVRSRVWDMYQKNLEEAK